MAEYKFPQRIWIMFYPDEEHSDAEIYRARLAYNTKDVKQTVADIKQEKKYQAMKIKVTQYEEELYCGEIEEAPALEAIMEHFKGDLYPLATVDAALLEDGFVEKIVNYLEAMKVVVAQDSGMEEVMHQRDRYYREDDEIQRCIDVIKNVKKA